MNLIMQQTFVIVAEYLAMKGHLVNIYAPAARVGVYKNVRYLNVLNTSSTTVLIILPWFTNFKFVDPTKLRLVIINFQVLKHTTALRL